MKSRPVERLLGSVRALRLARFVLHLTLLSAGGFLLYRLADAVAEKYLFVQPWLYVCVYLPVSAALAIRAFFLYASATRGNIAREIDRREVLKDRLSTYVELRDGDHPFLPALIEDIEERIPRIPVWRNAGPGVGMGGPLLAALVPLLVLLVLPYLPVPEAIAQRAEQHRKIAQEARRMEQQSRELQKQAESIPELKKPAAEMNQLAKELQKPDMDPAEALKKMNAMQDRLRDAQKNSDRAKQEQLSRELDRIAKDGKKNGEMSDAEKNRIRDMAKQLEKAMADQNLQGGKELQDAMKDGKLSREQMEKMKQAMEQYKDQKAEADKRMAELQQSLENSKKSAGSGKARVTYNSKIEDRNVDTGKAGVNDGPGTTNKDVGPQKFDTRKTGPGEYAEDRTKASYEQLYKGERTEAGKDPLFLNGQWDPQNARFTRIRSFGMDSDSSDSGAVSETVLQNDAESVITKEKVPASCRSLVKKYFDSIQQ